MFILSYYQTLLLCDAFMPFFIYFIHQKFGSILCLSKILNPKISEISMRFENIQRIWKLKMFTT